VTVVVDKSLDGSDIDIRCAPGASGTVAAAFVQAGFDLGGATSYVTTIDGVDPAKLYGAEGYWGLYTSTVDGTAAGQPAKDWTFASIGAGDTPVSTDQAYLFRVFDSWDCMMLAYDPKYADQMDDPSVCHAKPTLSEVVANTGTSVVPPTSTTTPGAPNAQAGAWWIASQLASHGDVAQANGRPDWGLTIDALIGLASTGVAGDQISATAAKLRASDEAYIGSKAEIGTKWPAVAKMVFALEVAGVDPTAFPTTAGARDLVGDLRSALNADGSFGATGTDTAFVHSYAMLALARTTGGIPLTASLWLRDGQRCDEQGSPDAFSFGWTPGCANPDIDTTALAAQALIAAGQPIADPIANLANQWLESKQDASGGFASMGILNSNSTGLVAQSLSPRRSDPTAKAAGFIGGLQVGCDTLAAHPTTLTSANLGVVAFDQSSFAAITARGLDDSMTTMSLRATVQAVLGLGGARMGNLTAQGAAAGVTAPSCSSDSGPVVTDPPANSGSDQSNSSTGVAPGSTTGKGATAATGGVVADNSWMILLAGLALSLAAVGVARLGLNR
jgi:hypothetical protein